VLKPFPKVVLLLFSTLLSPYLRVDPRTKVVLLRKSRLVEGGVDF
jgi:hypothetical protein